MNLEFLLRHTSIGTLEQNTGLKHAWLKSPIYAVEYYIRLFLARRVMNRYIDDMINHPELHHIFIKTMQTGISDDKTFCTITFDEDIPAEIRDTTPENELMLLAESFFAQKLQSIIHNDDIMVTYMMSTLFTTFATIHSTKTPFILLESEHIAHLMAIQNNKWRIILGTSAYLILFCIIVANLIKFFI